MDESHVAQAMKALGTDYMLISGCSAGCANGKGYDYIASKPWAKYNDDLFLFGHTAACRKLLLPLC
jgi:hypothetical protein